MTSIKYSLGAIIWVFSQSHFFFSFLFFPFIDCSLYLSHLSTLGKPVPLLLCVTVGLCISPANLITALCQWSSVFLLNLSALLNFITGDKMCICHSIFTTYSHITRTHSSPLLHIQSGDFQPTRTRQILWWQTTRRWFHLGICEW